MAPPAGRGAAGGEARAAAWPRRLADRLLGRGMTLALAVLAFALALVTFAALAGDSPFGPTNPGQVVALVLVNLGVLTVLGASLAGRLVRVWSERRRGSAGSRLHVRLVLLFGVVAVVPALLVAAFAAVFFNLGIQAWFSDRVRTALEASLQASRAYLEEHRGNIRADALAMANDLNRAAVLLPDNGLTFARILATHAALRNLTEAIVYEPTLGRVLAHAGLSSGFLLDPPSAAILDQARSGDVPLLPGESAGRVRAVVSLDIAPGLVLLIGRPVDPTVIDHMERTGQAVAQYEQLDRNRSGLQVTFVLIFAIAALLVLFAAALVGLVLANQLARPIARLIVAAERVRAGDLDTTVEEGGADDEVASLSRAFNRMTSQLSAQRGELLEATRQLDDRRRFTETVLAGVSAGVVGLDAEGRINLPNRSAGEKLGLDLTAAIGRPLAEVVPEMAELWETVRAGAEAASAEIRIGPAGQRRTLLARIGLEHAAAAAAGAAAPPSPEDGYVLTFDDVTELLSAQRKAAWADVARRIAHEIKNPLTPIQLSAERLKRKYLREITSDPDTFRACTDTIVRQVEDIGRMVDEFSAFARMPQPVIRPERPDRLLREALVLQRAAHPGIAWELALPDDLPDVPCDRRLLGQALTNLLQNAADAVAMRHAEAGGEGPPSGRIRLSAEVAADSVAFAVEDDGVGLPVEDRERLAEPYVTHKAKGTGLGLAIVKKIMEDHGGRVTLGDRPDPPGSGTAGEGLVGTEGNGVRDGTGEGGMVDGGEGTAWAGGRGARVVLTLPRRAADAAPGGGRAAGGTGNGPAADYATAAGDAMRWPHGA